MTNNYPKELDGLTVWACCVSIIDAGNCNHIRAREGRPLKGEATNQLLSGSTYAQAMAWEQAGESVRIGQKIRVTFQGLATKSGYAYREEGAWLGIRYTWKSMRWWSLLNYNNPLIKLEVQELTSEGKPYWIILWEREAK
jgi:hypothetical protein